MNRLLLQIHGALLLIGLLFGCKKREQFEQATPKTIFEKSSVKIDNTQNPAGWIEGGTYYDASEYFSVFIEEEWEASIGVLYAGLHLRMEHATDDAAIEVWSFQGIQYKPAPRDECLWSFVDKGLYNDWGYTRAVNVATCHPIENSDEIIYVYLLHKYGRTWQLEAHVSRDNLVEGTLSTEQMLRSITWKNTD